MRRTAVLVAIATMTAGCRGSTTAPARRRPPDHLASTVWDAYCHDDAGLDRAIPEVLRGTRTPDVLARGLTSVSSELRDDATRADRSDPAVAARVRRLAGAVDVLAAAVEAGRDTIRPLTGVLAANRALPNC